MLRIIFIISGNGIRTHDLLDISLLPLPLDKGPAKVTAILRLQSQYTISVFGIVLKSTSANKGRIV